jgi:hypothetical protein
MARPKDPEREHLWRQRLLRHSTSGLSITEFCSRAGVPCSSFYYWKRRLASGPRPALRHPPLFVPLHVDDQPRADCSSIAPGVEIELPHQVRLRFDSPPEPEWLGRVVAALAGLPGREATP